MDLNQQPRNGKSSRIVVNGSDKRSVAMATVTGNNSAPARATTNASQTSIQASSLTHETQFRVLTAEMELLNEFLFTKHGVRVPNVSSAHFKALHAPPIEMGRIKCSLNAALVGAATAAGGDEGDGDLDETLIVVKKEPWAEQDTLIVEPKEPEVDFLGHNDQQRNSVVENAPKPKSAATNKSVESSSTRSKKHACSVCGKAFAHPSHKNRHEMIHKGEKPYKCGFCPKVFATLLCIFK